MLNVFLIATVMMIDPVSILLCAGLSVMMGDYRAAIPVGAVIQVALMFGVGEFEPMVATVILALITGAALGSIGVLIRKKLIDPRREKAESDQ